MSKRDGWGKVLRNFFENDTETERSQRGGNDAKDTQRGQQTTASRHGGERLKEGEREREGRRKESEGKECVGFEFFTHNVKLLITALEHQHGESGPADCDLGSTTGVSVCKTWTTKTSLCIFVSICVRVVVWIRQRKRLSGRFWTPWCSMFMFKYASREKTTCACFNGFRRLGRPQHSLNLRRPFFVSLSHTHTHKHTQRDMHTQSWWATKSNRRSINMVFPQR